MKYFFVLGRNPILSKAEIFSYLESAGIGYKEILSEENLFLIEAQRETKFNIQNFGGVIKLGKILFEGSLNELKKFIENKDLIEKEKFTYSVMGNVSEQVFYEKFKKERRKAMLKRGSRILKTQEHDFIPISKAELEIFAYEINNKAYFGIVEQEYSYSEVKQRDMKKPFRRESLAISPRLAKILINLSQAKPGDLILDPFCGVGGILQEALLKRVDCFGIDKDKKAIQYARENLAWLEKNYKILAGYKLMIANSSEFQIRNMPDAIVTEPELGLLVKKQPSDNEAKIIINNFERMLIHVFQNLANQKKQDAKIVFTSPRIRNFSINIEEVCNYTGLRVVHLGDIEFPIREFRPKQFISRDVWVVE